MQLFTDTDDLRCRLPGAAQSISFGVLATTSVPYAAQTTVEIPDASVGGWGAGLLQASLQL